MNIIAVMQIPTKGVVIYLDGKDAGLTEVTVGTQLQQGDNIWDVTAMEVGRRLVASVPGQVGLLLNPMTPMPITGEIHRVV
jgi:hypothetical protein